MNPARNARDADRLARVEQQLDELLSSVRILGALVMATVDKKQAADAAETVSARQNAEQPPSAAERRATFRVIDGGRS